jgi:hypothetical protein
MLTYLAPRGEEFTLANYLADRGGALNESVRLLSYEELESRRHLESGAWIFSGLDRLTPAQRELAELAWNTLRSSGMPVRLLNRPTTTLLRGPLLGMLHESGINAFRAVEPGNRFIDLHFPVFVREKDAHTGSLTPLLHDRGALEAALGRLLLRGYPAKSLLVVEFLDTADATGIYRKYASYYVAGTVIPKAIRFGTDWMLKMRSSFWDPEKVREQEEWSRENRHADQIAAVFRMANIDYGRMDYAVVDGKIQVWEINLNPTLARGRSTNKPPAAQAMRDDRAPASRRFDQRFAAAAARIQPPESAHGSALFTPPTTLLDRVAEERWERERTRRRLGRRQVLYNALRRFTPMPVVQGISRQATRLAL